MNHTWLSSQLRAVLTQRSRLQDTGVSLLSTTAPVSGPGPGGLLGQVRGVVGSSCSALFDLMGDVCLARVLQQSKTTLWELN